MTKILIRLKIFVEVFFGPNIFMDQHFLKPFQAEQFRKLKVLKLCHLFSPSKHRFGFEKKNESKNYFGSEKNFGPEKNLGPKRILV